MLRSNMAIDLLRHNQSLGFLRIKNPSLSHREDRNTQTTAGGSLWLSHFLTAILALTICAVPTPAQRVEMRSVARERIQGLQRLRQERGEDDLLYQTKLRAAAREFGVVAQALPVAPQRPRALTDGVEVSKALAHPRRVALEDLTANLDAKYRLMDSSGSVLSVSSDRDELSMKLRDALSDGTRHSLYVEMKGYSEAKADALSSTLRIRQHLIDPTVSIEVLPHFEESLVPRENLFSSGIRLEPLETPIERIDSGPDAGKFAKSVHFSSRFGRRTRHFAARIVCATRELLQEVVEIIKNLLAAGVSSRAQSLSQLVEAARTEMMKRHPELTNERFRIDIVKQFGGIGMSHMLRRTLFAWS